MNKLMGINAIVLGLCLGVSISANTVKVFNNSGQDITLTNYICVSPNLSTNSCASGSSREFKLSKGQSQDLLKSNPEAQSSIKGVAIGKDGKPIEILDKNGNFIELSNDITIGSDFKAVFQPATQNQGVSMQITPVNHPVYPTW